MQFVPHLVHALLSHLRGHFLELALAGIQPAAASCGVSGRLLRALRHCDADTLIALPGTGCACRYLVMCSTLPHIRDYVVQHHISVM